MGPGGAYRGSLGGGVMTRTDERQGHLGLRTLVPGVVRGNAVPDRQVASLSPLRCAVQVPPG